MKRYLNERELSERTGLAVTTLQRWRMLANGPRFVKLSNARNGPVRYLLADVEAWEESCRKRTGETGAAA